MSGLVVATEAAERGAVVVLEQGFIPGGSMSLSADFVWMCESVKKARGQVPDSNATLQRIIIESIEERYA